MKIIKDFIKKIGKKILIVIKKTIKKNKYMRKVARRIKAALFPEVVQPPVYYEYSKFYPSITEYYRQQNTYSDFKHKPLISLVVPTYNTPLAYLEECIESVRMQSYPNWELCIADDASPNREVDEFLKDYSKKDKRIKYVRRPKNGHISAASNSAIKIAAGEFIALLDHDDVLWPNALYEIVAAINADPEVDFIYTDEDKIDQGGQIHSYPFFKPDWSPEFLESCNYITHFSCIRTKIIKKVGGFRVGYEGAQDWDLFIRISEITDKIVHIPKVLYSWRVHESSTAKDTDTKPYVYESQRKLLEDHIKRIGKNGRVETGIIKQHSTIVYDIEDENCVDVIIASSNIDNLKRCFTSFNLANRLVREIYILHNGDRKIAKFCDSYRSLGRKINAISVLESTPLVDSYNSAAERSDGKYMLFISDLVYSLRDNPLERMLADAQNDSIGVVGGRKVDQERDYNLSAGIAMGVGGIFSDLLRGTSLRDNHYLRSLYGNSRRNVAAVGIDCVMVRREAFNKVKGFNENFGELAGVDLCLKMLNMGLRNIYNPFVEVAKVKDTSKKEINRVDEEASNQFKKANKAYINYDPYFNPNFSKSNTQLDLI